MPTHPLFDPLFDPAQASDDRRRETTVYLFDGWSHRALPVAVRRRDEADMLIIERVD